jgi:hypothetical protein
MRQCTVHHAKSGSEVTSAFALIGELYTTEFGRIKAQNVVSQMQQELDEDSGDQGRYCFWYSEHAFRPSVTAQCKNSQR